MARNYGDPAGEYDAARNDVVVAARGDRSLLRVHGRDPVRMVQGLISNDIANTPPERAVYAAVLTPKGRMVADVRVIRRGTELLLETDASAAEGLTAHLRRFVPPLFARFEDAGAEWAVLSVFGPRATAVLHDVLGVDIPGSAAEDTVYEATFHDSDVLAVTTSHLDVPGVDLLCATASAPTLRERLLSAGARPIGHATLDVLRIEAGRPRWGAELTETTIPLEAGLRERAISETKGCYTGQEVIIRILHRGHVNWHLRGVLLGDAGTPAAGTSLVNDAGKAMGRITSAAWSPKHRQTIGLAYVRREVDPGGTLFLGEPAGRAAQVVELPFRSA